MSISITEVRDFVNSELIPLENTFLQAGFRAVLPILAQKRQLVKDFGWWLPPIAQKYGGLGMPLTEFAHISEELGRTPLGHYAFNCQAPDVGNMELLLMHGNDEQKEKWLEPLARGDIRSCFAMTEPEHAGSNPVWLDTLAVRDGDDYVIDGHKWFTSGADGAAFTIVMAVTNPTAKPHARASQIIVPMNTPGLKFVRNIKIMGEEGEDWASHAELRFDHCRVPITNRVGAEGSGFALAQDRLGPGRIHHCMRWIGICERTLELMCHHVARRGYSPDRTIGSHQAIQHWIAEMRADINAARFLVLDAAEKIEVRGLQAARVEISQIKFFVANVLNRALNHAIQSHGALGITDDTPLSWWYRHERGARIYDGPDEVHKNVVARQVFRQYGYDIKI